MCTALRLLAFFAIQVAIVQCFRGCFRSVRGALGNGDSCSMRAVEWKRSCEPGLGIGQDEGAALQEQNKFFRDIFPSASRPCWYSCWRGQRAVAHGKLGAPNGCKAPVPQQDPVPHAEIVVQRRLPASRLPKQTRLVRSMSRVGSTGRTPQMRPGLLPRLGGLAAQASHA